MGVIGSTVFTLLLWGTVLAVFGVFVYEAYAIGVEYGWLGEPTPGTERTNQGGGE